MIRSKDIFSAGVKSTSRLISGQRDIHAPSNSAQLNLLCHDDCHFYALESDYMRLSHPNLVWRDSDECAVFCHQWRPG